MAANNFGERAAHGHQRTRPLIAVFVALSFITSLFLISGARAEDTSSIAVQLIAGQPTDLDTFDIAWNSDYSYAVAVGENVLGGDNIAYAYNAGTGVWIPLVDWGSSGILYGVDYDSSTGYFYAAGEDSGSVLLLYMDTIGNYGIINAPGGVSSFRDIQVIDNGKFVVISDTSAFAYWFSGSWNYAEITGALPLQAGFLKSTFMDTSQNVIWFLGSNGTGGSVSMVLFMSDVNNGIYRAYDYTMPGFNQMNSGDHSPSAGYSLIAGNGQVTKLAEQYYSWMFTQMSPKGTPPTGRQTPAMSYCNNDMKLVVFGGYQGGGIYPNDTWEYNLFTNKWTQYTPIPSPQGRRYHSMAYNPILNEIIMFGGFGSGGDLQDTWKYIPSNHTWWQVSASTTFGTRYGHQLVFNMWTQRITTYGGYNGGTTSTMAEWNNAGSWTVLTTSGTPPSVYHHCMAYDQASSHIILFGGIGGSPSQDSETYSFDPQTYVWEKRTPIANAPRRSYGSMSWNYGIQGAMMYGGYDSGYLDEIWYYRYTDNTWYEWWDTGVGRSAAGMAVDYYNNIYIFGGVNETGQHVNDLFKYGRYLDLSGTGFIFNRTGYTWYDVDWYPSGTAPLDAIIVGNSGNISHHSAGSSSIAFIENKVTSNQIFAVACRPPLSPGYAIAMGNAGSGVKVNQAFTSSTVQVNVDVPHIAVMNLNTSAGIPKTNDKINVDSGSDTISYNLDAELYYSQGSALFNRVDLYGWFDDGDLGVDLPTTMGTNFDTTIGENKRFHYIYFHSNMTFFQVYPRNAALESILWDAVSTYATINATSARISFSFTPVKQFRAAAGPSSWTEPAGNRYNSSQTNGQETLAALNDPWTWDIKLKVNTTDNLEKSAYDEFGVFKYTYIGVGDVPATISGSGPPGGTVALSPVDDLYFVSNCNYTLKVYLEDILRGDNPANTMPANVLGVMGGNLDNWTAPGTQQQFNGTGSVHALYFFGNYSMGVFKAPRNYGVQSHTSLGVVGTVRWRCIIPFGMQEDWYSTTVTFVLEHD